jgi:CRISPR/Cas system CMR subunit Cmr4 (Cas7 group RAMP superfamily)
MKGRGSVVRGGFAPSPKPLPAPLWRTVMWDILKELLSPIVNWVYSYFGVTVAIVPQATWDMRKKGDFKKPISQSAALVVLNSSNYSVNIHEVGVCLREGKEISLDDFDLPVEIKPRNRIYLVLKANTFRMLAQHKFENVKYFFVEDALFRRYKVHLSKRARNNLLQVHYLQKVD